MKKRVLSFLISFIILTSCLSFNTVCVSASERLTATDADIANLVAVQYAYYQLIGYNEYDYEKTDYDEFVINLLLAAMCLTNYDEREIIESKSDADPLKKFYYTYSDIYNYEKVNGAYIDNLILNVFHKNVDHSVSTDFFYYYEGYYYCSCDWGFGMPYTYEVTNYKQLSDGRYYFSGNILFFDEDNGDDYYMVVDLQNVNGERLWTYYYMSKYPIDCSAISDIDSPDSPSILYPFEVSFKNSLYQTTDENGNIISDATKGSYKIEAYIINKNTNNITNVKVTLNLADGMNLAEGETLIKKFSYFTESESAEWIIEIPYLSESKNLEFSISVEADNMEKSDYSSSIYVEAMNVEDNRLNSKKDIWSFQNYSISSSNEVFSEEQKDIVLYGLNNAWREYLLEKMNSAQDGQCFGMATTAILNKIGKISPSDIGKENRDLYSLRKDEENVKGWINFYYLSQFQPAYETFKSDFQKVVEYNKIVGGNALGIFSKEFIKFQNTLVTEQLRELESKANDVKNGGTPVLIDFQFDQSAHTIVGYDVEYGNYEKCGGNYNARVVTYDCNYPNGNEDSYVYFNTGTNEWCIPEYNHTPIDTSITDIFRTIYTGANNEDGGFQAITNDINLLDSNNMTEKTNAYNNSVLWINHINEMNSIQIDGVYIKENGKLTKYYPGEYTTGITLDSEYSPMYKVYLADSNDHIIEVDDNSAVDVGLMYEDYYATVSSTNSNGVSFKNDGAVAITGNSGDYTIGLTANDGYASLPWYTLKVSGTGEAENPSLTNTSEGYIFEGESLKNIQVLANNDVETKELIFDSDKTSVLITNDNDNLIVKEDTDDDGIYDTIIADSDDETGEITTDSTTSTEITTESTTVKRSSGGGRSSHRYVTTTTEMTTEATTEAVLSVDEVRVSIGDSRVYVGEDEFDMGAEPYIQAESSSTMVPLRFVALAICGGDVENADESELIAWIAETKTAMIKVNGSIIEFTAGSDVMVINGVEKVMDNGVKAEIKDSRMYIPFRALGEALGVEVDWEGDTKTAVYKIKQ